MEIASGEPTTRFLQEAPNVTIVTRVVGGVVEVEGVADNSPCINIIVEYNGKRLGGVVFCPQTFQDGCARKNARSRFFIFVSRRNL